MARLVMKFGGTSVADLDRIRNVARHVKREVDAGHDVAVVVSAMAGVTNQLVAWCREARRAARRARIRRGGGDRRAGHRRAAGHRAGRHGRQCALLAGLAIADPDRQCAWRRPHPRHQRRRTDQALQGAAAGRGDRRLPGRAQGDRPHHHARPRRLRHLGGGDRRRHPAPSAATSIPTSTASTPPTRAWCRRRTGSTRSPTRKCWSSPRSAPRSCRCARSSSAWCTMCRIFVRSSFDKPGGHRPEGDAVRHAHMRRGRDRGTASRHRHRLLQGRGADFDPPRAGQARASPPRSSARWPTPTSMST